MAFPGEEVRGNHGAPPFASGRFNRESTRMTANEEKIQNRLRRDGRNGRHWFQIDEDRWVLADHHSLKIRVYSRLNLQNGVALFTRASRLASGGGLPHCPAMLDSKTCINPRRRRSACAEAAFRAQQERIDRMTVEERIKAALSMRERFAWLKAVFRDR